MRRSEKNSSGAGEERLLLEGARPTDRVELASRTEEVETSDTWLESEATACTRATGSATAKIRFGRSCG